jgi:hypothetical protein
VLKGVFGKAYAMHLDGDLLCVGCSTDHRNREPGFSGAVLGYIPQPPPAARTSRQHQQQQRQRTPSGRWLARGAEPEWGLVASSGGEGIKHCHEVSHGLFSHVTRVCADAGNALLWCAGDKGKRIKAFRAPAELGGPGNKDAACNRGEGNGMQLQYTLRSDGKCVGLHVIGTKVLCVTGECGDWMTVLWCITRAECTVANRATLMQCSTTRHACMCADSTSTARAPYMAVAQTAA